MQEQSGHHSTHIFHPKSLDPVIDEILRIFSLLQNADGSWGIEENPLDRAFSTSWVMRALYCHGYEDQTLNAVRYFSEIIEKYNYDIKTNFNEISKEKFLKGLMNCASLLKEFSLIDAYKFEDLIVDLLEELRKRRWISNEVASYVAIALNELKIKRDVYDETKGHIRTQLKLIEKSFQSLTPHICLAIPEELSQYWHNPDFETLFQKLTDLQAAHIFLALTQIHGKDEKRMNNLRNNLLSRLRERHFTEVDRKITKKFLDLALLLRSGLPPLSVESKMKDKFELVSIKGISSDRISVDIKFQHFLDDFGYLQLITMASYVLAIKNLGEDLVYLVPREDYDTIREHFVQETTTIAKKIENWYEISVLGWAIVFNAILIIIALNILNSLNSELIEIFSVLFGISVSYWGLFFRYFSKKFLPTIYNFIKKYALFKEIILRGDSNV